MHHRANAPISLPPAKRGIAQQISDHLADDNPGVRGRPYLGLPRGQQVELPSEVLGLLRDLFAALAEGQAVSIVPLHEELTTQEAADLLNISRQGLVDILKAGKLPYAKPNKHRRIRAADLLRYKQQRGKKREQALRELTQASEELGGYYGGD